jgi:predicted permease
VIGERLMRLERPATGALITASIQVNTGYVGFPLVIVFLGAHRLGEAVAYDALVTQTWLFLVVFAVGATFGSRAGETARERVRSFFARNPLLLAAIAALLVPDALAPDSLVDLSRKLVLAVIPLGFFAVGVNLAAEAEEGIAPALTRPVAVALLLRNAVAPALLFALALPFLDLPGPYLLLAAMPSGLNCLTVAHAYGLDLGISAGAVAWSTAVVLGAALVVAAVT